MMRVGFNARYLRDFSLRGFNRYTFCLLKALQRCPDIELSLFTDHRSPIHPEFRAHLNGRVIQLRSPKVLLWEQGVIPFYLWKRRMDIFHAPGDGGLPVVKACKYVLTYHDAADRGLTEMIRRGYLSGQLSDFFDTHDSSTWYGKYVVWRHEILRRLYLKSADLIITVSEYSKREIVELLGIRPEKVRVTRLAPDDTFLEPLRPDTVEAVKQKYNLPPSYILFVSGFDKRKNVSGLLRGFAELKRQGTKEPLVLVGSGGDSDATRGIATSLGLLPRRDVFFLEGIHGDLPAIYRGATLFTTLAWKETFCFPAVEAMASGLPVVASKSGAIPEIVGDGGILVDPRVPAEFVAVVKELLGNRALREAMGKRAAARARLFSWDKVVAETLQIYRELLQPSGRHLRA